MEKTKSCTYRKSEGEALDIQGLMVGTLKKEILPRCIGFFLAMAMPLPGMAPFGMAYLAQERKLSWRTVVTFILTSLGSLAVCDRLGTVKYLVAGAMYLCVLFVLKKGIKITDVTAGIIAGISVLISGTAAIFIRGFLLTEFVLLLCEAALVVSGTLMMEKSIQVIMKKELTAEKLDSDTKLSLAAVILVALLSLREIYLGSAFSVMNSVAAVMLLIISCGCGAGYSTGAGVVLGIVCGIGSDFFMPILGAFSFCGFLAGVFSKFGKTGTAAGIVLANGIMAVYTNSAIESVLSLYEIFGATVAFGLIPKPWIEMVGYTMRLGDSDRENIIRLKEGVKARLNSLAAAFDSMSKLVDRGSVKDNTNTDEDIAMLFDATADKVCAKCRKSTVCWGQDFNSTYKEMFNILTVLREKGVIKAEDIREHFSSKCLNLGGFLDELNHQFDVYRVKQVWRGKLSESRQLVGKQLEGMSEILEGLTTEIDEETQKNILSAWEIRSRLELNGIKPDDVNIMQDRYGRNKIEILIKASKCQGKNRRVIEKTIKSLSGCSVMKRQEDFENKKLIRMTFTEAERYEVETDAASMAANGRNGDNFRFLHLKNGKFIIAVSDGMGTGSRAAKESEAILELLDSLLEAGFESKIAVKLINSIMIMKSSEEAFVTLDLCIIDLYTGEVRFIKTGAEPSFIASPEGRVRTIKASSLPVGLIAEAEAEVCSAKVRNGDRIVMITDGVENRESGSLWVSEFIKREQPATEGDGLAKKILNHASAMSGAVKDDMTVLSVKLKAVS